jgi:hypothetical protein
VQEHNRLRLQRITERWDRQRTALGHGDEEREAERRAAFLKDFRRVLGEVLRPTLEAMSAELRRAGHDDEVRVSEDPPRLEWRLAVRGRTGSDDRIQIFTRQDPGRALEVIAELCLKRSPVEIGRYAWPGDITAEVAEQLLVTAVEQLFASPWK